MREQMGEARAGFESELYISVKLAIAALAVAGLALGLVYTMGANLPEGFSGLLTGLYIALGIAWLLDSQHPQAAAWFTILSLAILVNGGAIWLRIPGLVNLMVIPTALAAALIAAPGALAVATGQTIWLFLLREQFAGSGTVVGDMIIALTATWAVAAVLAAVYRQGHQLAGWSWNYYERAQTLLEEARGRKAELEQAFEDLTHANRQLALANERLAALRTIAEQAEKTKAEFVAKVSHEFRTPLNMIIGLVGLIVDSPELYEEHIPDAVLEDLDVVYRNCQHLTSMINDVLALSQAGAGQLKLHRERVDLAETIEQALAVVQPLIVKKGLSLSVEVPHQLPEVYCDRTRVRQVVLNLASNAARFTDHGGIAVRAVKQNHHVVVSIADTGPGISEEDAKNLFEPFWQGSRQLWRDKGGSGLGLCVSKQFIELHNGRIWFESEAGAGTTFFFDLPLSPPMETSAPPGRWISQEWPWRERTTTGSLPVETFAPRMIVCDEAGSLSTALAHCGRDVELIGTTDLEETARELAHCPAHVVLVNTLQAETLWSLTQKARRVLPHALIIGCTVPPRAETYADAGARDYLVKPVTPADLEAAIERLPGPIRRVMIADDDPDFVQLLARMLLRCDPRLEVVTASNGPEALERLQESTFDLALLDIVMPGMDGWQVLRQKGQDERIRDIPVVMVSAQDLNRDPSTSEGLLVTTSGGLSIEKLVECSLQLSNHLMPELA
jgi:signal transduction histidine kinase/CheY-like chemotaxis protein